MIEKGCVIRKKGELVEVLISSKAQCESCGLCHPASPTGRKVFAYDGLGAKINDTVEVFISPAVQVKISFILYMLPVLFFFLFYLLYSLYLYRFFQNKATELISALCGFSGIYLAFLITRIYQRSVIKNIRDKNYLTKIL
ncbi:MAG: SoxR reducing system RseC family protein [Spirochaetes bacterium]|nr:SoxR reducing system RseC family protein [Spirochaetota bacterium]